MGSAVEFDQTGRLTEAASATEMLPPPRKRCASSESAIVIPVCGMKKTGCWALVSPAARCSRDSICFTWGRCLRIRRKSCCLSQAIQLSARWRNGITPRGFSMKRLVSSRPGARTCACRSVQRLDRSLLKNACRAFLRRHPSRRFFSRNRGRQSARGIVDARTTGAGADTALTSVVTVGSECRLRNIATGLPYYVSSIYGFQPQPFLAESSGSIRFHTSAHDEAPAIEFDLQSAYWIERIVVHNSVAGPDRARSLAVSLSNDRVDYQPVFAPDQAAWPVFGAGQDALTIEIDATAPQRFVKLHLREKTYFHLDCVQVYVRSFLSDTNSPW